MNRRELLLTYLATQFKYLSYSFTNLYNSLIPTTISGKDVKNKARVNTIYGNSVVENQLVNNGNFADTSGWYTASSGTITASDNVCHLVSSVSGRKSFYRANSDYPSINTSHKYLMVATIKTSTNANAYLECGNSLQPSQSLTANTWTTLKFIASPTTTSGFFNVLRIDNLDVGETADIKDVYMIDLTQYDPFTPSWSLLDTRVQALINRGYIAYNQGSIKSVSMSEISTKKADTTALQTITFKYQGNGVGTAHDTLEITNNGYAFTKNFAYVDLGTLDWVKSNNNRFVKTSSLANAKPSSGFGSKANILCSKIFTIGAPNEVTNGNGDIICMSTGAVPQLTRGADYYNSHTAEQLKTELSGIYLFYELATPQVITIPKKHLAVVDLGTLNWNYISATSPYFQTPLPDSVLVGINTKVNAICLRYNTYTQVELNSLTLGLAQQSSSGKYIIIKDSNYTDATTFKNSLQGQYLFYETQDEVADITTQIDIEAGGTITSNSDVLPDARFDIKCK